MLTIKRELAANYERISKRGPVAVDGFEHNPPFARPTAELWTATSQSGELQWLEDPPLLGIIADAYTHIRTVILLEEKGVPTTHEPQVRFIVNRLNEVDPLTLQAITTALAAIDSKLLNCQDAKKQT